MPTTATAADADVPLATELPGDVIIAFAAQYEACGYDGTDSQLFSLLVDVATLYTARQHTGGEAPVWFTLDGILESVANNIAPVPDEED